MGFFLEVNATEKMQLSDSIQCLMERARTNNVSPSWPARPASPYSSFFGGMVKKKLLTTCFKIYFVELV
ncbi:MAG TPA: hypothetical protein VJ201_00775, partial [Candidatus Babeliales bacterium]|nr:hypothetical protein [Candidatus Babeliales bacterium]